jgi:hypothetical protein
MTTSVISAVIVGFLVPVFWGVLEMILFNAKESVWTQLVSAAEYVTCPFWVLKEDISGSFSLSFNAALYGSLVFLWFRLRAAKSSQ